MDYEGIVPINYLEHDYTTHVQDASCWSDWKMSMGTEREETRKIALRYNMLFHQDNTPAHTSSQLHKHGVPSEMPGFELLHRIRQAWSQWLLFRLFVPKLKNWWNDRNFSMTNMLYTLQMTDWRTKIKNSSTMESKLWKNVGPNAFQFERTSLCWLLTVD